MLPPLAREKLALLAQTALDSEVLAASAASSAARVSENLSALRHGEAADVEACRTELRRAEEVRDERRAAASADRQTAVACRRWIEELPRGAALEDADAPKPEHDDDLESVRARVAARQKELRAVRAAPLSADELKRRGRAYVRDLAASAAATISGTRGGTFGITFADVGSAPFADSQTDYRALRLLAWLDPERLTLRLEAEIDALPTADGLGVEERARAISELESQLLDLERQEESLVAAAAAAGRRVPRRPQADPRAVLGVRVAPRRAAAA